MTDCLKSREVERDEDMLCCVQTGVIADVYTDMATQISSISRHGIPLNSTLLCDPLLYHAILYRTKLYFMLLYCILHMYATSIPHRTTSQTG